MIDEKILKTNFYLPKKYLIREYQFNRILAQIDESIKGLIKKYRNMKYVFKNLDFENLIYYKLNQDKKVQNSNDYLIY